MKQRRNREKATELITVLDDIVPAKYPYRLVHPFYGRVFLKSEFTLVYIVWSRMLFADTVPVSTTKMKSQLVFGSIIRCGFYFEEAIKK
jgi:hypothetical protein